jgi:hypothetical protein
MASHLPRIRPLVVADAPACDAVIASLPYHPDRDVPDLWPGNKALLLAMAL